ncbi:phage holin family protein [Candidatus Curtissbacteria bacterium]|nr:phage holin family protein [Candidatus Curtissbacteria bacterium]
MKHYIRKVIVTAVSFYVAYSLVPTISVGADPKNLLIVVAGLVIISLIINPIFSLVLLPVNHLTFGLLMLILNIAFIFALLNFLPGFSVGAYDFPGANVQGVIIPAFFFNEITAIILVAVIITLTQKVFHIIFE